MFSLLLIIDLLVVLILVNIVQNGRVRELENLPTIREITGKDQQDLQLSDLESLSKKEVFQVFQQLPPADHNQLSGEYLARNLPQAVLSPIIQFITDHLFGPGRWVGKGFAAEENEGYNLFKGEGQIQRARRFKVYNDFSDIDKRISTHLDYREFNHDFIAGSMKDEIRVVNPNLILGMGKTMWGLGRFNPAHFVLYRE